MSDQNEESKRDINQATQDIQAKGLPLVIHAQYIKDVSFENPNAPTTLMPGRAGPEMDININLGAREIEDDKQKDLYEVTLMLSATAKKDELVYFIAEVQYCALASLNGVPHNQHHPMLFIEVPKLMFPFARQILSDLSAQGGYPPLLLNPVDFHAMYVERFAKELKDPASNGAAA
jgi:preprotein translocase subunit SecB